MTEPLQPYRFTAIRESEFLSGWEAIAATVNRIAK